jgi:hypothetical protein
MEYGKRKIRKPSMHILLGRFLHSRGATLYTVGHDII